MSGEAQSSRQYIFFSYPSHFLFLVFTEMGEIAKQKDLTRRKPFHEKDGDGRRFTYPKLLITNNYMCGSSEFKTVYHFFLSFIL